MISADTRIQDEFENFRRNAARIFKKNQNVAEIWNKKVIYPELNLHLYWE